MNNECVRRVGVDTVGLQPSFFILRGWIVVSYCVFCVFAWDCRQCENEQIWIYFPGSESALNRTFIFAAHAHVQSALEHAGVWGSQMSRLASKYLRFVQHMFTHLPLSASPTHRLLLLSFTVGPPVSTPHTRVRHTSMDPRIKGLLVHSNIPHGLIERWFVSTDRASSRAEDTCDGEAVGNPKHDYRYSKAAIETEVTWGQRAWWKQQLLRAAFQNCRAVLNIT